MTVAGIDRESIVAAEKVIRPHIRKTPFIETSGSDFGVPGTLIFKLELLQHAGSFKTRGAFTHLLTRSVPPVGVVAASGGNHGVAVSYAAWKLGIPAKIFVPSVASPAKIDKIRSCGANLVITGDRYADALAASERWAEESGALRVHAFDQRETLLGQGTLGLEIEQQAPEIDTLLVPVGGGGLIGGITSWFADRIASGTMKIIGVEPATAPTLNWALRAGGPVDAPAGGIAAESLAPRRIGELMFPIAQKFLAGALLVSDEAIASAQEKLWHTLRIVAEPGGATASAALFAQIYVPQKGERVGVVISGGNTAAVDFSRTRTSPVSQIEELKVAHES